MQWRFFPLSLIRKMLRQAAHSLADHLREGFGEEGLEHLVDFRLAEAHALP